MSVRLANINVSSITQTLTQDTQGIQLAQAGWIEYLNESPYTVELQLGGLNVPIPAWYDYPVQLQSLVQGYWTLVGAVAFPPLLTPILLANNLNSNVSTQLLTTIYLTGETPAITTPQPLVRQTYIPNTVNNVSGSTTNLQNYGNPAGTNILTSAPTGDPNNAVTLTNDAQFVLGDATHAGNLNMSNGSLTANTAGITTATVQSLVVNGTIKPPFGTTFSHLAFGNGVTGATGTVTVTHGLSIVPTSIVINGYNSINNSWGVINITASTFDAVVSSGNSKSFAWIAIA